MSNAIQELLNLAKVDNSRETFDKLAEALEVANRTFDDILIMSIGIGKTLAMEAIQQIQVITEGKGDE